MAKKSRQYRFNLRESVSPTFYNLYYYLLARGFRHSTFNCLSHLTEKNFQFNSTVAEYLEYKHLLARLVSQYCPDVMPETYCINDDNWSLILSHLVDKYYTKNSYPIDAIKNLAWILKPSMLNNGQHIHVFQQLSQIEEHFISPHRMGGEHVLQRYLTEPHLLKGHKYSIRMFVVLTNYAGAYLYPHGYFNVALYPYQANHFFDLRPHLTNEHLQHDEVNVVQIPSQQFDFFPAIFQQINTITTKTMNALKAATPSVFVGDSPRTLALFGFDFLVDASLRVWLLEANHGPCFPIAKEHPLQEHLYYDFWQSFIDSFILPIVDRQPIENIEYDRFLSLQTRLV